MPRKSKKKPEPEVQASTAVPVPHQRTGGSAGSYVDWATGATPAKLVGNHFVVRRVLRPLARELVTIAEDHPVWGRDKMLLPASYDGKIVRLRPPPGTPAEWTDTVADSLRGNAAAVRVVPPVLVPMVIPVATAEQSAPRLRPREVVQRMAWDALSASPEDRDALVALVNAVMDEEGL